LTDNNKKDVMNDLENIPHLNDEMEGRLWEFIDGMADASQRSVIEQLIQENAAWRIKYQELLELHQSINMVELEQPSLRFTKNVMEEISRLHIAPAAKNYINSKVIFGIAAFFITVIVGFLVYAISQVKWSAASDSKSAYGIDLTNVDYSAIFSNNFVNAFMMLNVLLGLMLLDRYLSNKKKEMMEGQH
jgi:hypothetical protein